MVVCVNSQNSQTSKVSQYSTLILMTTCFSHARQTKFKMRKVGPAGVAQLFEASSLTLKDLGLDFRSGKKYISAYKN